MHFHTAGTQQRTLHGNMEQSALASIPGREPNKNSTSCHTTSWNLLEIFYIYFLQFFWKAVCSKSKQDIYRSISFTPIFFSTINGCPQKGWGGGHGTGVQHSSGVYKALGLIHRTTNAKETSHMKQHLLGWAIVDTDSSWVSLLLSHFFFFLTFAWNIWKELSLGKGVCGYSQLKANIFQPFRKGRNMPFMFADLGQIS